MSKQSSSSAVKEINSDNDPQLAAIRKFNNSRWAPKVLSGAMTAISVPGQMIGLAESTKANREYWARVKALRAANASLDAREAEALGQFVDWLSPDAYQPSKDMLGAAEVFNKARYAAADNKESTRQSGRAATVYQVAPSDVAGMDLALSQQMGIDRSRVGAVHNLLQVHRKSRNIDIGQLSRGDSTLWQEAAAVGINGEKGLNLTASLLPELMRSSGKNDPKWAAAEAAHGLRNLADPTVLKQIGQVTGINTRRYVKDGKFTGENGVDGILGLSDALAKKGLTTEASLKKAGITNPSLVPTLVAMSSRTAAIRARMDQASQSAAAKPLEAELAAFKNSDNGKTRMREVQAERDKLAPPVTLVREGWDKLMPIKMDDPWALFGGAVLTGAASEAFNMVPMPYKAAAGGVAWAAALGYIASKVTKEDHEKTARRMAVTRFGKDISPPVFKPLPISSPQQAVRKFDPALQRQAAGRFGLGETPRSPRLERAANSAQKAGSTMQNINISVNLHGLAEKIFSIVTEANTRNARRQ